MKKNLTKNIPLKIMSIIVGILVWLIVVNVDDPIITKGFVISDVQIINEAYVDQLGEMVVQLVERQRPGQVEALREVAAEAPQELEVVGVLHALGDDPESQVVPEVDHRAHAQGVRQPVG